MMYHSKPLEPVSSPVTAAELNDWLRGVDECDPAYTPCLIAATTAVINWLELELLTRTRVTTWHKWPTVGTCTHGISSNEQYIQLHVELPYTNLIAVEAVVIYGEVFAEYTVFDSQKPAIVDLSESSYQLNNNEDDAIAIQYQAGFGSSADVPEDIKIAVMMAAAYMYDHRGSCSVDDILEKSGAQSLIHHHKTNLVVF